MSEAPAAYWISHVSVTDPEQYSKYVALATKAITEHKGEFLVRGGSFVQKEGPERPRNVVALFPSLAQAEACYNSKTYQEALRYARGASERELVLVEALPQD
ncbi:MAG: DUF1330 domain-containing protein [Pseudomonadota bacterium]